MSANVFAIAIRRSISIWRSARDPSSPLADPHDERPVPNDGTSLSFPLTAADRDIARPPQRPVSHAHTEFEMQALPCMGPVVSKERQPSTCFALRDKIQDRSECVALAQ